MGHFQAIDALHRQLRVCAASAPTSGAVWGGHEWSTLGGRRGRERYDEIAATAPAPLLIDSYNLATWPRFLEQGRRAAWHAFHNDMLARLSAEECDRRIAELVLEVWPQK